MNEGFGPIDDAPLGDFDASILPAFVNKTNTPPQSLAGKLLMEHEFTGPLAELAAIGAEEMSAMEIDTAGPVTAVKSVAVGIALETAGPVSSVKSGPISPESVIDLSPLSPPITTVQLQGVSTVALAGQLGITVEAVGIARGGPRAKQLRIEQDCDQLLSVATLLGQMARKEISTLDRDAERRNDPDTIAANGKKRELLELFAQGFEQLAAALAAFAENRGEPVLLGRAEAATNEVGKKLSAWWEENGKEAVGWAVRLPAFAAGVALVGWAGGDITIVTTAVGALVGGKPVIDAMRGGKGQ
jgi:hypothetical protein